MKLQPQKSLKETMLKPAFDKKGFLNWKQLAENIIETLEDTEFQLLATSMAFNTVLAIVPLLAVSLAVSTAVGQIWEFLGHLEPLILDYLATGTGEDFVHNLEASIARINSGALGATGMMILFLTSIKLLFDVDRAVQRVWGIRNKRPLAKRLMIYSLIILVGPVSLAFVLGFTSPETFQVFSLIPAKALSFCFLTVLMFLILRFVPNEHVYITPALITSALTSSTLLVSQALYAWVAGNVLYYNKVYGSLASVLLFLLWILIIWLIFLAGNVFCVALNKSKAIQIGLAYPDESK